MKTTMTSWLAMACEVQWKDDRVCNATAEKETGAVTFKNKIYFDSFMKPEHWSGAKNGNQKQSVQSDWIQLFSFLK